MVKQDYICPRCNYSSDHKGTMRRHLYRNRVCPNRKDLELTDEIRETVLRDYEYHPIKTDNDKIVNINNYNTLNKFLVNMDFGEKMNYLMDYKDQRLLDFEDDLENHFEYRITRLENDKYRGGYFLTENDFYQIINDVTKINQSNIEKLNVFYRKTVKRFELYRGTTWESYLEDRGVTELVSLIKSYFLDNYELYLIKHLHGDNCLNLNRIKLNEHLEIYYLFIATFELIPTICDQDDIEILGHCLIDNNERFLADKYMSLYGKIKSAIKPSDKNRVKRKVLDIVKENTVHNTTELNQVLLKILKEDSNFRSRLLVDTQLN